jgi:signal transduction histidine kinase
VVDTLAMALRLPHVTLTLPDGTRADSGQPGRSQPLDIPLVHANEQVGLLAVAPRSPNEPFRRGERRLLEELATQVAVAIRAASAAQNLREARRRIVAAVEEERRRLRRDLHDGVGARLTGLGFTVRAAQNRLADPGSAAKLLDRASTELQQTIVEVRGLIHDLRPPVLDDLGLVAAIEQHAHRITDDTQVHLFFDAPEELPQLAASVETAVYRIAVEACTNAVRHARATSCTVRLRASRTLKLDVSDDGSGIPAGAQTGVGMAAIRERAEEVGGALTVTSVPGSGTTVTFSIPLENT